MIALALAGAVAADAPDFDLFAKAVDKCDRGAVAKTVGASVNRHGRFLIDSYKEQRAIGQTRIDLSERRRKLRAGEKGADTDAVLNSAEEALIDRQRVLDDERILARAEQDTVAYFRQQYLTQCVGRAVE